MIPVRAITIGLFLLLLAACEDDSTTGQLMPLPYPGTYKAIVPHNGDTLELTLEYQSASERTLRGGKAAYFTVESKDLYGGYKEGLAQGSLFTTGDNPLLQYTYTFTGQSMTGPMTLTNWQIDIDTTVTFQKR